MADKSTIEWTNATWNPIVGCSILSPGCTHCYAMKMAARIEAMTRGGERSEQGSNKTSGAPHYTGTTKKVNGNAVWTGRLALAPERILTQPLRWKEPRRIFVNSMGDLFHEDVPDEWIDRVFAVMALSPQHTFQVLTKRAKRMLEYVSRIDSSDLEWKAWRCTAAQVLRDLGRENEATGDGPLWPLPNVWLGVSAERQQEADERIPELLATPAAIRFVSAEPLLGPIDFNKLVVPPGRRVLGFEYVDALRGAYMTRPRAFGPADRPGPLRLDWIIVGGESGPDARPMHPAWARSIRDQCAAAGAQFFFKQWGAWADSTDADDLIIGTEDLVFAPDGNVLGAGGRSGSGMHGMVEEHWRERGGAWMTRTTKKAAGRLLDGVEHNGMPEAS